MSGSAVHDAKTVSRPPLSAEQRVVRNTVPIYSTHLDLLRGVAALVVVFGHSRFTLQDLARPFALRPGTFLSGAALPVSVPVRVSPMSPAHEAVVVFFTLSGLLVGGSVLKQSGRGSFRWSGYLLKRLTRLYTVLIPALAIGALLDMGSRYILHHGHIPGGEFQGVLTVSSSAFTLLGNLCFLQFLDHSGVHPFGSNFSLWSLSYEFWYYLLFPLAVGAILLPAIGRKLIYALLACAVAVLLWKDPLASFTVWLLGALVNKLPLWVPKSAQRTVVLLALLQMLGCMFGLWRYPFISMFLNNGILGVSCSLFLYAAMHRTEKQDNKSYQGVAEHLSRLSYTMYLFHLPFLILLGSVMAQHYSSGVNHTGLIAIILTFCAYGYSYIMYRCFEAHTDQIREKIELLLPGRKKSLTATP